MGQDLSLETSRLQEVKLRILAHPYLKQFFFSRELRAKTYLHLYKSRKMSLVYSA